MSHACECPRCGGIYDASAGTCRCVKQDALVNQLDRAGVSNSERVGSSPTERTNIGYVRVLPCPVHGETFCCCFSVKHERERCMAWIRLYMFCKIDRRTFEDAIESGEEPGGGKP